MDINHKKCAQTPTTNHILTFLNKDQNKNKIKIKKQIYSINEYQQNRFQIHIIHFDKKNIYTLPPNLIP